jgi:hypothetical protein
MPDYIKLASYLNSFSKDDPNYDAVCFIKTKISADLQDATTVNNGGSEDLEDNDVTMSTPDQQSTENYEGALMAPAFRELDALNQIDKEKEKIDLSENSSASLGKDQAKPSDFGNLPLNQNMPQTNKKASLFEVLQHRLKK